MEVKLERNIDADSAVYTTPDGQQIRDRSANTAAYESTTTTGKQSAKGIDQTARVKTYVRAGSTMEIADDADKGMFGRTLTDPTMQVNGKTVDVNFMKAALGDSAYYTKYGLSKNNHDNLKTTYSEYLPYQFSDEVPALTEEEFDYYDKKLPEIQGYIENMKGGDNQEQQLFLDTAIAEVFGDEGKEKVAAYLDIKKKKEMKVNRENQPLSDKKIIYDAFKDPRMQEQWDLSVIERQNRDDVRLAYKGETGFQEEVGAALQLFNDVANVVDRAKLWQSQYTHMDITDEMLADGLREIPEEYRGAITDEAKKYGNERAVTKMEQLKVDIRDNAIYDDMNFAKQFLYGTAAMVASPLSGVVGAKGYQAASNATKAIRGWEATRLKKLATVGAWTAAAGAEATSMHAPRLIGDQTYTPRDLLLDVALDTTIGAALPMVITGGSKVLRPHVKSYLTERALNKTEAAEKLERGLKNEFTRETTEDTYGKQLSKGIRAAEKRRSDIKREEADLKSRERADSAVEGNTSTISTGVGPERFEGIQPIGDRPAVVGIDGVRRPLAEVEFELANEIPVIGEVKFELADIPNGEYPKPLIDWSANIELHGRQWDQADYTAAKKAGLRLEDIGKWTEKDRDEFNRLYQEKPLSQKELDAIASQERAMDVVDGYVESGLDESHTKAKTHFTLKGKIGQSIANITGKAMSHRLQQSNNPVMRFIGHNILEDPTGYAGNMRRHSTAALHSVREKNIAMSQILPNYAKHIDNWAAEKGAGFIERLRTTWGTPDGVKLAKAFEDEFIDAINARKMGRKVDEINPHVRKMLDDWQKFTNYAGNRALKQNLPGWGKLRTNYFPQIRNNQKMANLIEKHGEDAQEALEVLFEKSIKSTREAGLHELDDKTIKKLAKDMVEQAKTGEKDLPDSSSSKLGRAQSRVEMDWSVEHEGLVVKDFLNTDIASTADKYSSDLSGRLALNEVTGGKITTDSDIQGMKDVAYAKHAEAVKDIMDVKQLDKMNKAFKNEVQMMDDSFNMILGRPPRGGLAQELRHLKDFTTLTRMGVLGTSQSIETGSIIARSTMDLFNDPEVLKHLIAMSPDTKEGRTVLRDMANITGRTKDMEYLHRPSQSLDEESMKSYSNLRQMSVMLADKATGGSMKQPASRLLGKTSMFNWVQRHQSEFVQKSFLIHTDRYFNTGKCSISPKRMVDLGLINRDGTNTELSKVFKEIVKKDDNGHIIDLQWKKWSKEAQQQYADAAQRDEAQRLQQTFAGEAPAYYNKPLMNLLFQFREVPLVAQNKQLARSLAFGDVEAVSSVMLNLAIAGMVRYGWIGGIGYAKSVAEGETDNYQLPQLDRLDIMRYMAAGGMLPDAIEIANSGFQAYNQQDINQIGRQLPLYGVLKDGKDFMLGDNATNSRAEALQGLTLLGNTAWMDIIHTMLVKNIENMETHKKGE